MLKLPRTHGTVATIDKSRSAIEGNPLEGGVAVLR